MERFENLIYYNLEAASAVLTGIMDVQIIRTAERIRGSDTGNPRRKDIYPSAILYYPKDELWQAISRELIKKAKEGVEVRILFDSMGCRDMKKKTGRS